jgi:hypothetical protein
MKKVSMHLAFWLAFLGLTLGASPCLGHGNRPRLPWGDHQPSPAAHAAIRSGEAVPLGSPAYTFALIDFPAAPDTLAEAINSGATTAEMKIVGTYGPGVPLNEGGDGFLLQLTKGRGVVTETFRTIDYPGGSNQIAGGVNDSGQVVGHYDSLGAVNSYEFSGGIYTSFDVPFSGANGTYAYGIDNGGDIVGCWGQSDNYSAGFELSGGTYTQFQFPGGNETCAHAINNRGDITGYYGDTSGVHGFVLSGGTYTSIDVPGAVETIAGGINDAGDVVGVYCVTASCITNLVGAQGFLLSRGVFSTINVPGASATAPIDISNNGVMVGWYADCAGIEHSFIASP